MAETGHTTIGHPPFAIRNPAEPVACPFCDSTETEFFSLFSQFLLASQYYCRNCRTVFDVVRWTESAPNKAEDEEL
jgi:hypothetical protein